MSVAGGKHSADCGPGSDVASIVTEVKEAIEERLGASYVNFVPVAALVQVVAGRNFSVKINADGNFIHAQVCVLFIIASLVCFEDKISLRLPPSPIYLRRHPALYCCVTTT